MREPHRRQDAVWPDSVAVSAIGPSPPGRGTRIRAGIPLAEGCRHPDAVAAAI
jgi:hypothetical protein